MTKQKKSKYSHSLEYSENKNIALKGTSLTSPDC